MRDELEILYRNQPIVLQYEYLTNDYPVIYQHNVTVGDLKEIIRDVLREFLAPESDDADVH